MFIALEYYGIKNKSLAWFGSYLSNRLQYCSIDGHGSQHQINPAGIPALETLLTGLPLSLIKRLKSSALRFGEVAFIIDENFWKKYISGDPQKYSCLINRKIHNKREIFGIEACFDYQ